VCRPTRTHTHTHDAEAQGGCHKPQTGRADTHADTCTPSSRPKRTHHPSKPIIFAPRYAYYNPGGNQAPCTYCGDGYNTSAAVNATAGELGATDAGQCRIDFGFFNGSTGRISACLRGYYKDTLGPQACNQCPAGTSTTKAQAGLKVSDCDTCKPGFGVAGGKIANLSAPTCGICASGSYSSGFKAGGQACDACPQAANFTGKMVSRPGIFTPEDCFGEFTTDRTVFDNQQAWVGMGVVSLLSGVEGVGGRAEAAAAPPPPLSRRRGPRRGVPPHPSAAAQRTTPLTHTSRARPPPRPPTPKGPDTHGSGRHPVAAAEPDDRRGLPGRLLRIGQLPGKPEGCVRVVWGVCLASKMGRCARNGCLLQSPADMRFRAPFPFAPRPAPQYFAFFGTGGPQPFNGGNSQCYMRLAGRIAPLNATVVGSWDAPSTPLVAFEARGGQYVVYPAVGTEVIGVPMPNAAQGLAAAKVACDADRECVGMKGNSSGWTLFGAVQQPDAIGKIRVVGDNIQSWVPLPTGL
jgi:hypothetical protein